MKYYNVFLKKELFETAKTLKLLALAIVFLFFAVTGPIMAKMLPQIMEWAFSADPLTADMDLSALGLDVNPTALDAWLQFYGNIGQMGLIVIVAVFSGMIASEISKGTIVIILTKGMPRYAVVLAKMTSVAVLWSGLLIVSFLVSSPLTAFLFPGDSLPYLIYAAFCLWVFGLFIISLTTLASVVSRKGYISMILVGAVVIVLNVINIIPRVDKYNPISLANAHMGLIGGSVIPSDIYPALITSFVLCAVLAAAAVFRFNKKRL